MELVPCTVAAFPGHDGGYDRDTPGLYPDLLRPKPDGGIRPLASSWTSAWVDITVEGAELAGSHEVPVRVTGSAGEVLFEDRLTITVLGRRLPELAIVNSHWFHCDGLASFYGVEVFSEEHWNAIDKFIASAAEMGVNSLLTPTWTPPLDTAIGGERLPTQLIGIAEGGGEYSFDFSLLERWLEICARHGIKYLEIAHLFTQWGARFTPAIYVTTGTEAVRRFGWDVPATDPSYRRLMAALLPELRVVLSEHWSLDRVFFHISDEPHGEKALASYLEAKAVVADLLEGVEVVDALSDYAFYTSGAVNRPIVATDAVGPFLEAGMDRLWVYYCTAQDAGVANRFIAMPSARNRVLGHQLFAMKCSGFLHWGFNFYNTAYSVSSIDPFKDTCAGGNFQGGDSFMVYPGDEGTPWASIRFKIFAQAMADHRAFTLLEELAGRAAVMDIIDSNGQGGPLAMDSFNYDPVHYLRSRQQVNEAIAGATP
ncbi:DUF4091 domain-containing protein [Arthrobacter sedimenti]|uniref:DUF4091 domain-containing protein n=1 Tax=Arthrobacter sedimenti TaxID=2694931 RepID=UPI001CDD27F7|nr:DUF4091 domain-containing protein [Arthrobacter sedimenti]